MSGIGNIMQGGQIGESSSGRPFLTSANNGTSLSTLVPATVVLGQNVNQAGAPAALLSAREIPMAGFGFNMFGGGVFFSQERRAAPSFGLAVQVDDNTGLVNIFSAQSGNPIARGVFTVSSNGQVNVNDVNTGAQGIGMKSRRFVNAPLPSQLTETFSITSTWEPDNSVDPALMNDFEIGSRVIMPSTASVGYSAIKIDSQLEQTVDNGASIVGIWYSPQFLAGPLASQHIGLQVDSGDVLLNASPGTGGLSRTGIQQVAQPTAYLEIGPSTGNPGETPLKLDPGTLVAAPEQGAFEYDAVNLYFTRAAARETVFTGLSGAAAPALHATPVFTSFYGLNTNALGAPNSWASVNILGTVYKIPLYT